jgi:hypothetical protein
MVSKSRENIGVKLAILRGRKTLLEQAIRSLEAVQKIRQGQTATGKY